MSGWPDQPVLYEVDTWPWLQRLSAEAGRTVTLGGVPREAWDGVVARGVDAVWLMGVWERSPAGLALALANEDLVTSFHAALPDLGDEDVVGSPYCVRRYVVDERLGGPAGLAVARAELARRGARLVLDYVPNHVAPDHPWAGEHREHFVQGTPEDAVREPDGFVLLHGGAVLARGRDPYFAPWPDVLQLNAFSPALREATADVLCSIGDQCDGVRCDMAMLVTNDVFARTWSRHVGEAPADEFWTTVIQRVRASHPELVLLAEAYWDLEWVLQQQGFDFCYDKRLYDRLVNGTAEDVRAHLTAELAYQRRLVRFIENHDEPRAAASFAPGRERAAAVVIATLPGAPLFHDGQFEGKKVHLPVFLGRAPNEPEDAGLRSFYRGLVEATTASELRRGAWALLDVSGWPDNASHVHLLAWSWSDEMAGALVVVNFSDEPAQGMVRLPWHLLEARRCRLDDVCSGERFERDGDELLARGLFVDLPAWGAHVLVTTALATALAA